MKNNNREIRERMKEKKVYFWEIGKALNISENTMVRKAREELPEHEKAKILSIIDQIAKEKESAL